MLLISRSNTLEVLRLLACFFSRGRLVVWYRYAHVVRVVQKRILRPKHRLRHKSSFCRSVHLGNVCLLFTLQRLLLSRRFLRRLPFSLLLSHVSNTQIDLIFFSSCSLSRTFLLVMCLLIQFCTLVGAGARAGTTSGCIFTGLKAAPLLILIALGDHLE